VPRYIMVAGDRAEMRGLNLEGLRRNGFTDQEVFNFLILVCY
jgi:UDP-N-acetylglucosamine acyltransferase